MRGTWGTNLKRATKVLTARSLEIEDGGISYRFQDLPWKKIFNLFQVEASLWLKPDRSWGWPTYLQMEASALCNLRCALCPAPSGLQRPQGLMKYDLFKKVIDEIGEYVFLLMLWDWGEPLLNPEIDSMITYAQQRGIAVVCSTNGIPLTDEKRAAGIARSGLDTLIVSIDGVRQETYERFRHGGQLESVLQGIRNVVAQKRHFHLNRPRVVLQFIVMKHNEHEISAVQELAKSLSADACTLRTLNPFKSLSTPATENSDPLLTTLSQYRRAPESKAKASDPGRRWACPQLWNSSDVHWNGTVCSCCYDYAEHWPLGDLRSQSFKRIWNGAPYKKLRRQVRRNPQVLSNCQDCFYTWGYSAFDPIVDSVTFPK
jgi:radical SAM protein with 4Fe4S-binding SPASM domain